MPVKSQTHATIPSKSRLVTCAGLVEMVGVVPLAETPRSAIINCRFCLTIFSFSYFRKAKRSLPFTAPPSTPTINALSSKKEKTAIKAVLSFLVEMVGVEPTSYSAAKKLSTYLVYLLFLNFPTRVNTL